MLYQIYNVGDELIFKNKYGMSLRKIDKITPSGRIVCGTKTLNPNLTIRGAGMWDDTVVIRANAENKKEFYSSKKIKDLLNLISHTDFSAMDIEALEKIMEIILDNPPLK